MYALKIVLNCLLFCYVTCDCHDENSSLKLVFAVARHGERVPEYPFYPKDIYNNETYFPYGPGSITNLGREKQYEIGKYLRQRYNKYLGFTYYDGIVSSRSTDFDRTKASLLALLAGLFPPKAINIWSEQYLLARYWQPIPFDVSPLNNDPILLGRRCPAYTKLFDTYRNTEDYVNINNSYSDLFAYLEENTGIIPFNDIGIIRLRLFYNLEAQEVLGLKLPEWTKSVYPGELTKPLNDAYYASTATADLRKYVTGFLLKEIIGETEKKKNGTLTNGRKMYVYNCHEINIAGLLITLKVYNNVLPKFSAYIIFEVHEIGSDYYFKVLYQNFTEQDPIVIKLPGCKELCRFDKFVNIFADSLPGVTDTCQITT